MSRTLIVFAIGVVAGAVLFSPVGIAEPFENQNATNGTSEALGNVSQSLKSLGGTNTTAYERELHERINAQREKQGVEHLQYSNALAEMAEYHAEDMANNSYFAHTSPSGVTMADRYRRFGISCAGAENIFHLEGTTSKEAVVSRTVDSWMDSPPHRQNILSPSRQVEGIGVAIDGDDVYVVENFC